MSEPAPHLADLLRDHDRMGEEQAERFRRQDAHQAAIGTLTYAPINTFDSSPEMPARLDEWCLRAYRQSGMMGVSGHWQEAIGQAPLGGHPEMHRLLLSEMMREVAGGVGWILGDACRLLCWRYQESQT